MCRGSFDAFEEQHAKLVAEHAQGADPEDPEEYRAQNIFWVPPESRWAHRKAQAKQPTIGRLVDDAMAAIEFDNPALKGVLPKDYARPALDKTRLGQLIDLVTNIDFRQPSPASPLPVGEGWTSGRGGGRPGKRYVRHSPREAWSSGQGKGTSGKRYVGHPPREGWTSGQGEGEIRKNLIGADLVACMVALPGQVFYSTQIPACLSFIARDKRVQPSPGLRPPSPSGRGAGGEGYRGRRGGSVTRPSGDRRGQMLFIDARKLGRMVDRSHRELTDEEIQKIARTYHAWRTLGRQQSSGHPLPMGEGQGEGNLRMSAYADIPGFRKSATLEEVRKHGYVLTPGRYVAPRPKRMTTNRSARR